jgi:aconitate hydratase
METDFFGARSVLKTAHGEYTMFRLEALEQAGLTDLTRLPYSIRILLEAVLRHCNQREVTRQDVINLAGWQAHATVRPSLPFRPARVIMQDFTGVPAVVDLAAMRAAVKRLGGDPSQINPLTPVDLVIDHSVQVDFFSDTDALQRNNEMEFLRNKERYEFLHWGQKAFKNFRVVPPATGIIHQVNLEYLAQVVSMREEDGQRLAFPDTLVGTDSHTTMINGLGVVGWGVGGIEAEAAMLGQPIDMLAPDVVGVKLLGTLPEGVTATDLVLTVTQILRQKGVVEKFVEFYGPGLDALALPDRATVANMAPEYGATMGFFPVDDETLRYLRLTGRPEEVIERVERYTKEQGLFRCATTPDPEFSETLELDLNSVTPSLAGPKRPQDHVPMKTLSQSFQSALVAPLNQSGFGLPAQDITRTTSMGVNGGRLEMGHGAVVIAAITSCTNTSNPGVMMAAGLLAQKAIQRGLKIKSYVKTSLAPGSRVVTEYLQQAGLLEPLAQLGFNVVGYGCTTCIGNSGPLPGEVIKAITSGNLVAAAVLSGNRNFEGRIHPYVRANYLASPPLVVAYALAGTVNIDLSSEPLGVDAVGKPVFLRELWPTNHEIAQCISQSISPALFTGKYAQVFNGNQTWNAIQTGGGELYEWKADSTYIQEPPFFEQLTRQLPPLQLIHNARVLALLGDSITTDHISPAGSISADSPAGKYLLEQGMPVRDFNSYGSRRGNDRLMARGTFANIRLKNRLVRGVEGGFTNYLPEDKIMSIYDAAMNYREQGTPLIILAGKEYGTGSSRDWAAKGTLLLGVRAIIAETYERIHRTNLIGMGVLPLQFMPGESVESLGLTGSEHFTILGLSDDILAGAHLSVEAIDGQDNQKSFQVIARLDTPAEVEIYRNGGILPMVLRKML